MRFKPSFLDLNVLFHKLSYLLPIKHRWPVSFVLQSQLNSDSAVAKAAQANTSAAANDFITLP